MLRINNFRRFVAFHVFPKRFDSNHKKNGSYYARTRPHNFTRSFNPKAIFSAKVLKCCVCVLMQLVARIHRTHAVHLLTTGIDDAHNNRAPKELIVEMPAKCFHVAKILSGKRKHQRQKKRVFTCGFWIIKSEFEIWVEVNSKCCLKNFVICFY